MTATDIDISAIPRMHDNHRDLGLSDEQVVEMYRLMLMARRVDDRMWALNRQGRAPFVVSSSGHEATQICSVFAMDPARDWILPYYRDMGVALAWGVPPIDIFLEVFSKKDGPMSGGRQLPNHWSDPDRNMFTHSSAIATQFPHGAGIAHALSMDGSDAICAVYGGEGSTSEGDWHEMMNYAGIHELPLVVIIENNQYAISVPATEEVAGSIAARAPGYGFHSDLIDGNDPLVVYKTVKAAVERARSSGGPTLIEAQTYRYYAHTSDDDDRLYRTREEVAMWRRRDPIAILHQYLIEERLLPEALEQEIENNVQETISQAVEAAESSDPADDPFGHVYARPIVSEVAATAPEPAVEGETINMITAVNRALHEIMEAHDDVIVFGEDVADPKGGVFKATAGLTDRFGQDRCFNAPLAESVIIGAAVGFAAVGKTPIPEIQFADYIHPAFDQIVSEVSKTHYRSNGRWALPMVIRVPYGGGIHGALYHSQSIESYYAHVPGLKVVVPSTPADVKGLLWEATLDPDPVLFLEPKKLYRLGTGPYPAADHRVPLGKAAIRRAGTDLTILVYGAMTHFTLEAAEQLAADGINAEVVDLRSLKPLDWPTIEASVQKTSRVLIVHEDNEFVGYGAELAAQIADKAFEWLDAPIRRYASPDVPTFPFAAELEAQVLPNTAGIVERAQELVRY